MFQLFVILIKLKNPLIYIKFNLIDPYFQSESMN